MSIVFYHLHFIAQEVKLMKLMLGCLDLRYWSPLPLICKIQCLNKKVCLKTFFRGKVSSKLKSHQFKSVIETFYRICCVNMFSNFARIVQKRDVRFYLFSYTICQKFVFYFNKICNFVHYIFSFGRIISRPQSKEFIFQFLVEFFREVSFQISTEVGKA